jgi:glucose-1-phosphate thymidylyltransferase
MTQTMKIAIPMAGFGTRMRPHTWSKPKPLIHLAGKTVLDFVLAQFDSLPESFEKEYVLIVGAHQLDAVKAHMAQFHTDKKVQYAVQVEMNGQSDALYQARALLSGPMMMSFSDTLIETDLAFLAKDPADGIAWVQPVPDPRRFGVAKIDAEKRVTKLIEKPTEMDNNLAVVGFYYFRSAEALLAAIEEQMQRNVSLKNEFFLTDAINIMLEKDIVFRTQEVVEWLDAGIPEALLETSRYYLSHGHDNSKDAAARHPQAVIIPPVYIPEDAQLEAVVVGPYASLGQGCNLKNTIVSNSIVDTGTQVENMILEGSLVGRNARLQGRADCLNLGDNACMKK